MATQSVGWCRVWVGELGGKPNDRSYGVPKGGLVGAGAGGSAPFAREKPPSPFGQSVGVWEACFCPSPSEGLSLSAGVGSGVRRWPKASLGQVGFRLP